MSLYVWGHNAKSQLQASQSFCMIAIVSKQFVMNQFEVQTNSFDCAPDAGANMELLGGS